MHHGGFCLWRHWPAPDVQCVIFFEGNYFKFFSNSANLSSGFRAHDSTERRRAANISIQRNQEVRRVEADTGVVRSWRHINQAPKTSLYGFVTVYVHVHIVIDLLQIFGNEVLTITITDRKCLCLQSSKFRLGLVVTGLCISMRKIHMSYEDTVLKKILGIQFLSAADSNNYPTASWSEMLYSQNYS